MRTYWDEAKQRFGLGREILVALQADGPDGVFDPEVLATVARLTEVIEAVDGVDSSEVRSISNSEAMVGTADGLEVMPFFEEPPTTREEAQLVRKRVFENPVYIDRLICSRRDHRRDLRKDRGQRRGSAGRVRAADDRDRERAAGKSALARRRQSRDRVRLRPPDVARPRASDPARARDRGLHSLPLLPQPRPAQDRRAYRDRGGDDRRRHVGKRPPALARRHRSRRPGARDAHRARRVAAVPRRRDGGDLDVGRTSCARLADLHRRHAGAAATAGDRLGRRHSHRRPLLRARRKARRR